MEFIQGAHRNQEAADTDIEEGVDQKVKIDKLQLQFLLGLFEVDPRMEDDPVTHVVADSPDHSVKIRLGGGLIFGEVCALWRMKVKLAVTVKGELGSVCRCHFHCRGLSPAGLHKEQGGYREEGQKPCKSVDVSFCFYHNFF